MSSNTSDVMELDPERQRLARRYAAVRRRLFFVELGLGVAGIFLLLMSGWSEALRGWAEGISTDPRAVVALYCVVLGIVYLIISLPLDFYSGYILPHRYGLSTQSLRGWVLDVLKSLGLSGVLGLVAVEGLYGLMRAYPAWWWVLMAISVWLFAVLMTQLAPVVLMPIFYRFRPLNDPELVQRLMALAGRAGAKVRGVYVMDLSSRTVAANAMLVGLGPTRRIILGDTLLHNYTPDEIETILAHELAHHVHGDLPRGLIFEAVVMLAGMWVASLVLSFGVKLFGFRGIADVAALPLFALAMMVFGLIVMPAGNFLTRQMERAADRYAVAVTGKAQAFRSAMIKLAGQNLAEADPPAWVRFLFHSHPPISERIRMTEEYGAAGQSTAA